MEGWKNYFIEDFGDILTGTTPSTKKSEYYGGPYKFISPANLDNGKYINTSHKLLTEEGLKVGRTLPKNAILVGCIGNIGKIGMTVDKISSFNQQINAIICSENFDADFIYYLILHHRPLLEKAAVKTTLPILNKGNFQKIKLQAPDLFLQRKIAYVLSTMQKAIERQDQLIKTTTELKKVLMQKLFTEGLNNEPQKETDFGYSPESWKVQLFENTGEVVYGIQAAVANNLKPIGKKILTNKNITLNGRINLEKLNYFELSTKRHFQTILQKGDLLFNWRSGSKEHVGKTAIFDLTEGEYTHSSFILRIRVNEKHHSLFLFYYLNFLRETGYYQKVQTYSINAKFNKSAINAMPIALPDKDEQIKIAQIISTIDKKLDNLIEKKKANQDIFKTLLHDLMTGQRMVHKLEFEGMVKEYELRKQPLSMAAEE